MTKVATHCANGHARTPETVKENGHCRLCPARTRCGRGHELTRDNRTSRGKCRECARARSAAWDRKNRDRATFRSRRHYEQNREAYNQRASRWARDNPERRAAIDRTYAERHPDRLAERRRLRLGKSDAETRRYLELISNDPCAYCGGPYEETDHIIPVVAGGANHWTNLAPACLPCNRRKGASAGWVPWRLEVFQ